jgi:two-component system, NarL family, response regulator NreC
VDRIRVLLADDHALVRAGLRALLEAEPDIEVIGEASSGEAAVELAGALAPDVVVMDLSMPGLSGLDATARISSSCPAPRVLVLTMHPADDYLLAVLRAGGSGYVTKDSADQELMDAIRTVASGHVFLYPSAARLLLENFRVERAEPEADPLQLLSAREREVLRQTVHGFTATEIAEGLSISPKTVDTYRQRAMEKLKLRHRSELVQFALKKGLLTLVGT